MTWIFQGNYVFLFLYEKQFVKNVKMKFVKKKILASFIRLSQRHCSFPLPYPKKLSSL